MAASAIHLTSVGNQQAGPNPKFELHCPTAYIYFTHNHQNQLVFHPNIAFFLFFHISYYNFNSFRKLCLMVTDSLSRYILRLFMPLISQQPHNSHAIQYMSAPLVINSPILFKAGPDLRLRMFAWALVDMCRKIRAMLAAAEHGSGA